MTTPIKLEDVLGFSASLNLEKGGIIQILKSGTGKFENGDSTFMNIIIGIVFLVLLFMIMAIVAQRFSEGGFLENLILGAVLIVIIVGGGFSGIKQNEFALLTPESKKEYQSMERKWMRELATPYVEQLPLQSEVGIASLEYDYDLETMTDSPPVNKVPVKVTTKRGKVHSLWAEVIELKEEVPSILTYTHLEEDLRFHELSNVLFEKGYYNGKLYTYEEI